MDGCNALDAFGMDKLLGGRAEEPCRVEVSSGLLEGRRAKGVKSFKGVPFAAPPVGELRFRSPREVTPWTGVKRAYRPGASALQLGQGRAVGRLAWRGLRPHQSEDCLYLNIWAPDAASKPCPVLVFVHGGAFVLGSGSSFLYNGRQLASRYGVVVVTVNYRLGALGFLNTSTLARGEERFANLGLQDQVASLRWVAREIAAFGGDPNRITLAGQSAGAMSVGALLGSPKLPFKRALLASGAAANVSTPGQAASTGRKFLALLGVGAGEVERLRELSAEKICAVSDRLATSVKLAPGQLVWQPSVDGDWVPEVPFTATWSPEARDVLVGTVTEEWRLFSWSRRRLASMPSEVLRAQTKKALSAAGADPARADQLLAGYQERPTVGRLTHRDLWNRLRGDQIFRLPALDLALALGRAGSRPMVYEIDAPLPFARRRLSSCHASDLPLLFGSWRHPLCRPMFLGNTEEASHLEAEVQRFMVAFLRDGVAGLEALGHPAFCPERRSAVTLRDGIWQSQENYERANQEIWRP